MGGAWLPLNLPFIWLVVFLALKGLLFKGSGIINTSWLFFFIYSPGVPFIQAAAFQEANRVILLQDNPRW